MEFFLDSEPKLPARTWLLPEEENTESTMVLSSLNPILHLCFFLKSLILPAGSVA